MAKRILIADDSVTIQKAFAMTFGAEDVAVTIARSADDGLNLARQTHPDLVIADAAMPGRSGYELCAAIKGDVGLRTTPVYILVSTLHPYDEAKGQQVGADGHLIKPWETGALIEKMREALGKGPSAMVASAAVPAAPTATQPGALEHGEASTDGGRDTSREMHRQTTSPSLFAPSSSSSPLSAPASSPGSSSGSTSASLPSSTAASMFAPAATPPRPTSHGMPAVPHGPLGGVPGQPGSGASMRPSLIPGVRPGVVPPARPGMSPVRSVGPGAAPAGAVPPRPTTTPVVGRTMIGLPAANMSIPGMSRPGAPSMPPSMPPSMASPLAARSPTGPLAPLAPLGPRPTMPSMSPAVSAAVDQKIAAFAARGPEYEAIAKLSREVIEQIVWEVVPELAEIIIREHVEKRGRS